MTGSMLVYDPLAARRDAPLQRQHAVDGLAGKVIGFIDNSKPNFNYLADDLEELLVGKYRVAAVVRRSKPAAMHAASDRVLEELCEQCDAVIAGSGD